MCLALPGKVLAIMLDSNLLMGDVDFSGVRKKVCLAYTPEAKVGDYVVTHVGFAISIIDENHAQSTLELINKIQVQP